MSETQTPSIGTTENEQTEDQEILQWQAAERAQQKVVAQKQVELLEARAKLDRIRGQEAPKESLLTIVNAFPKGIPFPFLRGVYETTIDLAAVREELVKEGKIRVNDKKRGMTLFPVLPKPAGTEVATK